MKKNTDTNSRKRGDKLHSEDIVNCFYDTFRSITSQYNYEK